VVRFIRAPIGQIRDCKLTLPRQQLFRAADPQRLEITEVPHIFLDRPRVLETDGARGRRERADPLFQARRASTESLQNIGKEWEREIEGELSFKPALHGTHPSKGRHMTASASSTEGFPEVR
jgi:hypothetical protein